MSWPDFHYRDSENISFAWRVIAVAFLVAVLLMVGGIVLFVGVSKRNIKNTFAPIDFGVFPTSADNFATRDKKKQQKLREGLSGYDVRGDRYQVQFNPN